MRVYKKNFFLTLSLIVSIILVFSSIISANSGGYSIGGNPTIVSGNVYYSQDNTPASGAEIVVMCEDSNNIRRTLREKTTCDENGNYVVVFNYARDCDELDVVSVIAKKDQMKGTNAGMVRSFYASPIDVELYNGTPVVPEFGTFIGILTALSAIGIFFIVRRKK